MEMQAPPPNFEEFRRSMRPPWVPAAIVGAVVVLFGGLVGGAVILNSKGTDDDGPTTCEAWTETRQSLRSAPRFPPGWNWNTPNIDGYIKLQNAPVAVALDSFERHIDAKPANLAQAANQYVAARRNQMQTLADHTYVVADGVAVDVALEKLNQLCGIDN